MQPRSRWGRQLPLRQDDGRTYLPPGAFEELRWQWGPLPPGFTGEQLREQARRLAWTAAPANEKFEAKGWMFLLYPLCVLTSILITTMFAAKTARPGAPTQASG